MANNGTKSSIQVLERMMSLLDALAANTGPVNLKQLAAKTSLHPSTTHRILGVMVDHRLVDRIEPGTYRLGIHLLELGNVVKSRINIRDEALPFMQKLHDQIHETVNLSIRQGDEMVYVERLVSSRSMMRVVQLIGARAPLHITAVGKIFLLEDGPEKCREYTQRSGLQGFTKNTLNTLPKLSQELEKIRKLGYAFDNEEAERGVSCIGAGIHDDEGRLVAGLSISAPSERLNRNWAALVKETADDISYAIGYRSARMLRR